MFKNMSLTFLSLFIFYSIFSYIVRMITNYKVKKNMLEHKKITRNNYTAENCGWKRVTAMCIVGESPQCLVRGSHRRV